MAGSVDFLGTYPNGTLVDILDTTSSFFEAAANGGTQLQKLGGGLPPTNNSSGWRNPAAGTNPISYWSFVNPNANIDWPTTEDIFSIVYHFEAPERVGLDTLANFGLEIRVGTGTAAPFATNYRRFAVAGNDTFGGKVRQGPLSIVIDPQATGTADVGTFNAASSGVWAITSAVANIPPGLFTNQWIFFSNLRRIGTTKSGTNTPRIFGGTSLSPASFTDLRDIIEGSDYTDINDVLTSTLGNSIFIALPMVIGKSANSTYFDDGGLSIVSPGNADSQDPRYHLSATAMRFYLDLQSGDTAIFSGSYSWGTKAAWDFNQSGATVTLNNPSFIGMGRFSIGASVSGTATWQGVDTVDLLSTSANINGSTFRNTSATGDNGALSLANVQDLSNMTFQNNAAALEINVAGTYNLSNCQFTGNTVDVLNLSGGAVVINVTGGGTSSLTASASTGATTDTPSRVGSWTATTGSYTAGTTGGNNKGLIAVLIEGDSTKVPDSVTFGGTAMTLATSIVQGDIGLSLWYLFETGNTSVFSGAQTISPTYTGGAPTNEQYHAATFDNILQSQTVEVSSAGNSQSAGGGASTVSLLDDWSAAEPATYTPSAGTDRLIVLVNGNEDIGGGAGGSEISGATIGGVSGTIAAQNSGLGGSNSNNAAIVYWTEANISSFSGNAVAVTTGATGGTIKYRLITLENVDQTTPLRDSGSDSVGSGASTLTTGTILDVEDGDYIVGVYSTGGGTASPTFGGLLDDANEGFLDTADDNPVAACDQVYSGSTIANGEMTAATGAGSNRSAFAAAVFAAGTGGPVDAGNLTTDVAKVDRGLVVGGALTQASTRYGIGLTLTDGTEQVETDFGTQLRGAVADNASPNTTPGTTTTAFTETSSATGADAAILAAHFEPSTTLGGGASNVTVNAAVTVTITVVDVNGTAIQNARVFLEESGSGNDIFDGQDVTSLTDVNGQVSTTFTGATPVAITGRVRKSSSAPFFQTGTIAGSITGSGFSATVVLVSDE